VLEARLMAGASGFDVVVPTADFLRRQIRAGVYQPLDRALLPNLGNLDPDLMAQAATFDAGNAHAVIYMWGTTGIGYNVQALADRLGPDAPVTGWGTVFDPEVAAQLADCGIALLDSVTDMIPAALAWLGRDPMSTEPSDFEAAAAAIQAIRPHLRYFHSSRYVEDLASGEICLAVGYSGDVFQAMDRAAEAGTGAEVAYVIPSEGAMVWFDMLAIPADAPNPAAAHAFIDFLLRPDVAAANVAHVYYASPNTAAEALIDPDILADPAIYPPPDLRARLFVPVSYDARADRALTRLWTRVRTGQ
jgi:putrescine transport system substrate-binding protein